MTGRSIQVAPLLVEYWNLATPTSSVADTLTVTGALVYQLLLPVEIDVGAKPYAGRRCAGRARTASEPTVSTGDVVSGRLRAGGRRGKQRGGNHRRSCEQDVATLLSPS